MSRSLDHQDRAGRDQPLGAFINGELAAVVPAGDIYGHRTRARIAAERGVHLLAVELLLLCPEHQTVAAVDCTTCVPIEDEERP